eukprot:4715539-Pyramimonas_sp.AAC.2
MIERVLRVASVAPAPGVPRAPGSPGVLAAHRLAPGRGQRGKSGTRALRAGGGAAGQYVR